MRILQLTNKIPYPPKDGGSIATFSLSENFADAGHELTILAMNTGKHYYDINKIPGSIKQKMTIDGVYLNTDISPIDALKNLLFSKLPYNAVRFRDENYEKRLVDTLKKHTFDIILLEGLYLCFYIDVIRKYSKAHIAYRAHNIEHEIWQRTLCKEKNKAKKLYLTNLVKRLRKLEIDFVNKYDSLIPITTRDGEIFRKFGNTKKIHVTPTGISLNFLSKKLKEPDYKSVFLIGALDWTPNIEGLNWFLKESYDDIVKAFPDVSIYVAGRNAGASLVQKLKQYKNIVYLGEVEDAYEYIESKGVMIVPILSGSGMRIKIIEGMALQKAIVTTTIGTEGINTENNKNIIIADEPKEFSNAVIKLLQQPELQKQIGTDAKRFVYENYDNRRIADNLIKFFSKNI